MVYSKEVEHMFWEAAGNPISPVAVSSQRLISSSFAADRAFGPAVAACRRAFDFALFFEELFFDLICSSLLLDAATRLSLLSPAITRTYWCLEANRSAAVSYFGLRGRALLCLGRYLFLPLIPRLCLAGFTFWRPSLATELVRYLGDDSAPRSYGYEMWLNRSQPIQLVAVESSRLVEERNSVWHWLE
ncbi:unnamed protein product [Penicillium camemberti]|uniref:Str. FM013 n=1 Tax=Penicillium camemberti (strain FM 013) TaxID=1429867 RepID=A0A0G4P7J8_PENC3|nr:unnamed protein product [Penicillium camemberti]